MSERTSRGPASAAVDWRILYRTAGLAAGAVVAIMIVQIAVFFVWPPPASAADWFKLFAANRLVGLLDMDLLLTVDYALLAVVYLAIALALMRTQPALATIAALLAFLGTAAYFASTAAFNMMALSDQYALAATEGEKSEIMAAGRATVALWTGNAFDVGYVLSAISILAFSLAMARSEVFDRATVYAGFAMGVLMIVPPTAGTFGVVLSLLSLIPTAVWLVLLSRQFFAMASKAA